MKILLYGSGGREHALALALSQSPSCDKFYATPGNPGIFTCAEKADVNPNDYSSIVNFCKSHNIDLVFIGPEQPLAEGLTDLLTQNGINVFGPSKYASQLEASKGWAKEFMKKYNIPTASFKCFDKSEKQSALDYLNKCNYPVVIKADGLAAGKGVIIAENHNDAVQALEQMFGGVFKDAGNSVVIEDFLEGEEASIMAVCDGKDFVLLAPSQDHKKIGEGDTGKNTGGMGAYAPAKVVTDEIIQKVTEQIIKPVIEGMVDEGHPFIGCLYAGIMICKGEPFVVEFNVRFGDPETQVVLPVFEGDFAGLVYSAAKGHLDKSFIKSVNARFACCVILASQGYPDSFEKGFEITGLNQITSENVLCFQAGTKESEGKILTNGGRVLGITGLGSDLKSATANAYQAVSKIHFQNKYYRKDIAHRAL